MDESINEKSAPRNPEKETNVFISGKQEIGEVKKGGKATYAKIVIQQGGANIVYGRAPDFSGKFERFRRLYLGTPDQPVPFGGRRKQLEELEAWLYGENQPPYGLLIAPAGRGKSALIVRWLEDVMNKGQVDVIFIPISIRLQTASKRAVFGSLAKGLAEVSGETWPDLSLPDDQYRELCEAHLQENVSADRTVLIVLDGLDEATGWEMDEFFFPEEPPAGMRVLVSARTKKEGSQDGWRKDLGWQGEGIARQFDLPELDEQGVKEVVESMGNPLDNLAERVDVIKALHRLSEGDPLMVGLYVDLLHSMADRIEDFRPEDLEGLEPGLGGYFERWWRDQRRQWKEDGKDPDQLELNTLDFLYTLSWALGPISDRDFRDVMPPNSRLDDNFVRQQQQEALQRYIIKVPYGDGSTHGYTFSHPKLADYFRGVTLERLDAREWEQRFVNFGEETLLALGRKEIDPRDVSPYIVQNYGEHLLRAKAPDEQLYALVSEGWLRAWEGLEGTYSGFLSDVDKAWNRADRTFLETQHGKALEMQVRCALCLSSTAAISSNFPSKLPAIAAELGELTPLQALIITIKIPDKFDRSESLEMLARAYSHDAVFLEKILETAYQIGDEFARGNALTGLAEILPESLLPQVLEAAHQLRDPYARANALTGLVEYISPIEKTETIQKAFEAACQIDEQNHRAHALVGLGKYLLPDQLQQALAIACRIEHVRFRADALSGLSAHLSRHLLSQALDAARQLDNKFYRAKALAGIARHLPPNQKAGGIQEAIQAANDIWWNEDLCAEALTGLGPYLPRNLLPGILDAISRIENSYSRSVTLVELAENLPRELLPGALEIVRHIENESTRAGTLTKLAEHLPIDLMPEVLETARIIELEYFRAEALSGVTPYLSPDLLLEALEAARQIGDEEHRAKALSSLVEYLPVEQRTEVIQEALESARKVELISSRVMVLTNLGENLPHEQRVEVIREALKAARQIGDEEYRAVIQVHLSEHLSLDFLLKALETTQRIEDEYFRADTLIVLAGNLPPQLLPQILIYTFRLEDEGARSNALAGLAEHLPPDLIPEALAAARKIENPWSRARALGGLAERVLQDSRTVTIQEALEAARLIEDEDARARTLAGLAKYLPAGCLPEVFQAARQTRDDYDRADIIIQLAEDLPLEFLPGVVGIANQIEDESDFARALTGLIKHLPAELFPEVLKMICQIADEDQRAEVLAELGGHLPLDLVPQAIDAVQQIAYRDYQSEALAGLAGNLSPDQLPQTLNAVCQIEDTHARAGALSRIAEHLPQDLLLQALDSARLIEDAWSRAMALNGLVRYLTPDVQSVVIWEALEATCLMDDHYFRTDYLSGLTEYLIAVLKKVPLESAEAWVATIKVLAKNSREEFLTDLINLMNFWILLIKPGDRQRAAAGIFQAIQDVGNLWP